MKNNRKAYSGVLAKPMVIPDESATPVASVLSMRPLSPTVVASNESNASGDFLAFIERIEALFDHYGVKDWDWVTLCLEMATQHVPGFSYQRPSGRPEKWLPLRRALLVAMVERERAGKSGRAASVSAACGALEKAGVFGRVTTAERLRSQYYAGLCDRGLANVIERLIALDRRGHLPTAGR
jgi:hypothetical protein